MKGIKSLFLGIFGTFAFSWVGLILIPNYQIGHLDPQMEEDDIYPMPKSGMAERGRQVYAANGCAYCHSQQMRADYAGSDLERTRWDNKGPKWGDRRSAPRDYVFDRPVLLGKMRFGPDLANIGKSAPVEDAEATAPAAPAPPAAPGASPAAPAPAAAGVSPAPSTAATTPSAAATAPAASPAGATAAASPAAPLATTQVASGIPVRYSADWHHRHLYSPRSLIRDSNMPAYQFLYQKRRINSERAADSVKLDSISDGWEVVPTYDAKCLVAYLMSLDQSHALKEVKGAPAAAAPAAPEKK